MTYRDIDTIAEGCVQVGMEIKQKDGKRSLYDPIKAYKLLRSWIDKENEQEIKIKWGRDQII